jgi:hypothetical protein
VDTTLGWKLSMLDPDVKDDPNEAKGFRAVSRMADDKLTS